MKAILVVIVYLNGSKLSKQLWTEQSEMLNDIIASWQEKLKQVDIIHLIVNVERDTEIDIRLLAPGELIEEDRAILRGFKNQIMSNLNNLTINDAKSFYE